MIGDTPTTLAGTAPQTSLAQFRARFPIFGRRVYLNSCSQGALSVDVEAALGSFLESWRAEGSPWDRWVGEVERLRAVFAASIGADPGEVAVMPNASTALSAVASLVGAPLTHDFAAVSLSDLLTPWAVIEKRLHAAGEGDFVIALYNPQSKRRDWQLKRAQEILLQYKVPDTPVAVVKSAYREGERIVLTTLDRMAEAEVGMLTTILIGNASTFRYLDFLVTPRGYSGKYDLESGEILHKGIDRPGRSLNRPADFKP